MARRRREKREERKRVGGATEMGESHLLRMAVTILDKNLHQNSSIADLSGFLVGTCEGEFYFQVDKKPEEAQSSLTTQGGEK